MPLSTEIFSIPKRAKWEFLWGQGVCNWMRIQFKSFRNCKKGKKTNTKHAIPVETTAKMASGRVFLALKDNQLSGWRDFLLCPLLIAKKCKTTQFLSLLE